MPDVARVVVTREEEDSWGTAWLARSHRVVTALHVLTGLIGKPLSDADRERPVYLELEGELEGQRIPLRLLRCDVEADLAVFEPLQRGQLDALSLLGLAERPPPALSAWSTLGFPAYQGGAREDGLAGQVQHQLDTRALRALKLSTATPIHDQGWFKGFSGAPVLVDGRVTGVILEVSHDRGCVYGAGLGRLTALLDDAAPGSRRAHFQRGIQEHLDRLPRLFDELGGEVSLRQVYVEVQVSTEVQEALSAGAFAELREERGGVGQRVALRQVLEFKDRPRWVLLGEPGSGKSTLLRKLALDLFEERWLPVPLKVADLLDDEGQPVPLADAIRRHLGGARSERAWQEALDGGRAVLLLDGFDEALDLRVAAEAVHLALDDAPDCPVILSSRPEAKPQTRLFGFEAMAVCPLGEDEQAELLRFWLERPNVDDVLLELRAHPRLLRMAENPLLLTLVALVLRQGREEGPRLPRGRAGLYRLTTRWLIERNQGDARRRRLRDPELTLRCLELLALHLHGRERELFLMGDMERVLNTEEAVSGACAAMEGGAAGVIHEIEQCTSLLSRVMSRSYQQGLGFAHRSFREYLAASALARVIRERGLAEVPSEVLDGALHNERPPMELDDALAPYLQQARANPPLWAEVLALCCGVLSLDAQDVPALSGMADHLLRRVAAEGQPKLLRRVLGEAEGLSGETLRRALLGRGGDWQARRDALLQLPELVGKAEVTLSLLDRIRETSTDGNDLWFAREVLVRVALGRTGQEGADWSKRGLRSRAMQAALRIPRDIQPAARAALLRRLCSEETALSEGRFVDIPEAVRSFKMGSPEGQPGAYTDEHPKHPVWLSPFALLSTPVTNAMYEHMDPGHARDRRPQGDDAGEHPVVNVTWYEAAIFAEWLGGRLPTEAEWECAARAGTEGAYWWGDSAEELSRAAWWTKNADGPQRVGRPPSPAPIHPLGLHDLLGNVWEWCLDHSYRAYPAAAAEVIDPCHLCREEGDVIGVDKLRGCRHLVDINGHLVDSRRPRVVRGGSWADLGPGILRCAYRSRGEPGDRRAFLGFRVVRRRLREL